MANDYKNKPKVRRFEELICWQKARALANTIRGLTLHPAFLKDFRLRDQILGASGSIMHNIAEGCDAGTDPEFIRFLKMARRSVSEVQSELYLALDRKYITETELKQAYAQGDEVKRLINGLISCLRQNGQNSRKVSLKNKASTLSQGNLPIPTMTNQATISL